MDMYRSLSRWICTVSIVLLFQPTRAQAAAPDNVSQAIAFLKAACVTTGSSLDLQVAGDGALLMRGLSASGIKASVTLTKKELEGFADAASALSAQQASEMRNCMKPYIDKILAVMLTGTATGGVQKYAIETGGFPFVTEEFDRVIAAAAGIDPDNYVPSSKLAASSGLSAAKVRHYGEIAEKNGLGDYSSVGAFHINGKGISYAISRNLIK